MITATSLKNPSIRSKLGTALLRAARVSHRLAGGFPAPVGVAHVQNREGVCTIRVEHHRGKARAFRFYDQHERDITTTVLVALRPAPISFPAPSGAWGPVLGHTALELPQCA